MISGDFLVITEVNGKKLVSYSDYINLQSEYVRETEKQKAEIEALRKQVEELGEQNTDIQNCHMKLQNDGKNEIRELNAEIQRLKEKCGELPADTEKASASDYVPDYEKLYSQYQDQHRQDCIKINDLITTINVLSELYVNLWKNVEMD